MHVSQDQLFMMNVQNQCCQFFKILIKKDVFLQRVVCVLCHAGAPIYNWKKLQLEKVKTKKGTMYKFKK